MAVEAAPRSNGLKTAWDTIVAPKEALTSLRVAPTWGWALLIVVILSMLSTYLITPANIHGLATDWPNTVAKNPALAGMAADRQQAQLGIAEKFTTLAWLFTPIGNVIAALIGSIILLIFNALGRGDGTFGKYWAAQWNISVVSALGALVLAIIVIARGADSFDTAQAVATAMPSLAMLVPASNLHVHMFLAFFTPFSVWVVGLEIAALTIIGNVSRVPAWLGGALTLLLPALVIAALAR
jgi:hypothetical protein